MASRLFFVVCGIDLCNKMGVLCVVWRLGVMDRIGLRVQILGILCRGVGLRSRVIADSLGISMRDTSYALQCLKDNHLAHNRGILWYSGEGGVEEDGEGEVDVIGVGGEVALSLARAHIAGKLRGSGKDMARTGGIDRGYLMRLTGYDAAGVNRFVIEVTSAIEPPRRKRLEGGLW